MFKEHNASLQSSLLYSSSTGNLTHLVGLVNIEVIATNKLKVVTANIETLCLKRKSLISNYLSQVLS